MEPASGLRRIKLRPHEMSDTITASEDVFVLAHLGVPRIDPAQWRLSIDGLVGEARTLGLDDLKARPKSIVEAVHQCCGNPLEPNLPTRRVVNVRWGGVDLAALLDELGVDPRAVSVVLWPRRRRLCRDRLRLVRQGHAAGAVGGRRRSHRP